MYVHWIFSIIIVKLSGVWYSLILTYLGEYCHFIKYTNNARILTPLGWGLTIALLLINIISAIADRYHELHNEEKEANAITLAQRNLYAFINEKVNSICQTKLYNQILEIEKIRDGKSYIPYIYTKPCNQLKTILEKFTDCVAFLISSKNHRFKSNDFSVSLIYNFPLENDSVWKWSERFSPSTLSTIDLLSPDSTFSYLISDETSDNVFFNSKQDAYNRHHYIPSKFDEKDKDGNLKGSIGCFYFDFGNSSNVYIRAVLSIDTKRKPIIDESELNNDEDLDYAIYKLSHNIIENLIENYKYRIGIELCNCYIQYLREKKNKKNNKEKDCS